MAGFYSKLTFTKLKSSRNPTPSSISPAREVHFSFTAASLAIDYTVAVLDRRLGDELNYLGAKDYDPAWNNGMHWSHVGYPEDVGGFLKPALKGPVIPSLTPSTRTMGLVKAW